MNPDNSPHRSKNPPQTCRANKSQSFKSSKFSPSKKMSPAGTQKNCYEKSCCGHTSRSHFNTFLIDLQNEIKRIEGSISVSFDEKTVLNAVLSSVRQAVDYILLVQSKFSHTDWADLENFKSNLKLQEAKLKNENEKLKITARHLDQYDSMLRSKEEQVKSEEKKYLHKLDLLKQEDLLNEELKLKCIQLEQEIRLLKKQKVSNKDIVESSYITEIENLKKENIKLKEILYNKNTLNHLDSQRTKDQLTLNKEKCKLENVKIELNQLKLAIEKEKNRVGTQNCEDVDGKGNEEVREDRRESRNSEFAESINSESDRHHSIRSQDIDYRECLLIQSEKELQKSVLQIKESIQAYNEELEAKEKLIEEQSSSNLATTKMLQQKLINLKLIEESLNSSKLEIDEINSSVLPSFESYSQAVSQLLADLYSKKQELTEMLEKVNMLLENLEMQEVCFQEEAEKYKENFEDKIKEVMEKELKLEEKRVEIEEYEKSLNQREEKLGLEINEKIMVVGKELEEGLKNVRLREKEIERIKEELDAQRSENEKIAVKLKITHLELENNRIKQIEKLRIKKEKLRELKEKVEGKKVSVVDE